MRLQDTSEDFRKFFLLRFTKEVLKNSLNSEISELGTWVESESEDEELTREIKEKLSAISRTPMTNRYYSQDRGEFQEPLEDYSKSRRLTVATETIHEEKPFETFQEEIKEPVIRKEKIKPLPMNIPKVNQLKKSKKSIIINKVIQPKQQKRTELNPLTIPPVNLPKHLRNITPIPSQLRVDLGKLNPLLDDMMVRAIECNGPDTPIFTLGRRGRKKTNIELNSEEIELILNSFSEISRIPISSGVYRVAVGRLLFSAIISEISETRFIISKINPSVQNL